jgi:hypothetical protein
MGYVGIAANGRDVGFAGRLYHWRMNRDDLCVAHA